MSQVYVSSTYDSLAYEFEDLIDGWWHKYIWIWKAPLKLQLFVCLALEGKILVGEDLQKREFTSLFHCVLCSKGEDIIDHIFTECVLSCYIWLDVIRDLQYNIIWDGYSFELSLKR